MGFFQKLFGKKGPGQKVKQQDMPSGQENPQNPQKTKVQTPRLVKRPPEEIRVFEGYYFSYQNLPNGWGGYHPVNLTFNHDEKGLHKQITSEDGTFLEFPGVVEGSWRQDLVHTFREQIEFVFSYNRPSNEKDLLDFCWMVQPDGRYYADEDGFGMENDEEIVLVAGLDRQGRFTGPFHAK